MSSSPCPHECDQRPMSCEGHHGSDGPSGLLSCCAIQQLVVARCLIAWDVPSSPPGDRPCHYILRDYRQLDDTFLPFLRDVALLATRSHLRLWYSGWLATTCPSSSGTVNIGHAMSLPRGPWMVGHAMPLPQLRDSKLLATPRLSLTPGDSGWLATQCPPPSPTPSGNIGHHVLPSSSGNVDHWAPHPHPGDSRLLATP